jgi:hypothetical protein
VTALETNVAIYPSPSHIATDGQSVSKSWCRAPSGAHDHIFITVWHLRPCFCGAPSLTRGRVCLLYMLLTLASAFLLGSESLGTPDHILLSQIWDFPFPAIYPFLSFPLISTATISFHLIFIIYSLRILLFSGAIVICHPKSLSPSPR